MSFQFAAEDVPDSGQPKVALKVLVLAFNPHVGAADGWLRRLLEEHKQVRRIESEYGYHDSVFRTIRRLGVNTILLAVHEYFRSYDNSDQQNFKDASVFIERVRQEFPKIVFVLGFPTPEYRREFLSHTGPRFDHYLCLFPKSTNEEVLQVLRKCDIWHRRQYQYEVALSFAGEDRSFVEAVAGVLVANGVRVFYDRFEQADLLGKDLYQHFQTIYKESSRYCAVFTSENYASKLWTNHELRQAQARVFSQEGDYILPIRLDDAQIPGINETTAYLDGRKLAPSEVADIILQKLFHRSYKQAAQNRD